MKTVHVIIAMKIETLMSFEGWFFSIARIKPKTIPLSGLYYWLKAFGQREILNNLMFFWYEMLLETVEQWIQNLESKSMVKSQQVNKKMLIWLNAHKITWQMARGRRTHCESRMKKERNNIKRVEKITNHTRKVNGRK